MILVVGGHLSQYVTDYQIPENLQARFQWLAQRDSEVYQDLLAHFQKEECRLIADGLAMKVPLFLNQLRTRQDVTRDLRQIIRVGNHQLTLEFRNSHAGVSVRKDPEEVFLGSTATSGGRAMTPSASSSTGCLGLALVTLIFTYAVGTSIL